MKLWPFGGKKSDNAVQSEILPVPTYLKSYFVPDQEKCNMAEVTGNIRCTCGGMIFKARRSEDYGCLFGLECASCGKEILLFDSKQHGWDALVCGVIPEDDASLDCAETCAKCSGEDFYVTVWIEACQKEEFIEDITEGLTEDDWVNAYDWFGAHLICAHCGHKERDWADVETA